MYKIRVHGDILATEMLANQLAPYRRHLQTCAQREKGQAFTLCECPIWAYGALNGRSFRRSLQTSDWPRAMNRIEILLRGGDAILADAHGSPTVHAAITAYLDDARARNLRESTIHSYRKTLALLGKFIGTSPVAALGVQPKPI